MLSMEFPDGKTAGWHVGEPFPEISAQVVSFLADGDELAVILAALRPKPQAEPAPQSPIEFLIHRVENGVAEFAQFDEVPMLEKTKVLALLYQAQAIQRIAQAMEATLEM